MILDTYAMLDRIAKGVGNASNVGVRHKPDALVFRVVWPDNHILLYTLPLDELKQFTDEEVLIEHIIEKAKRFSQYFNPPLS